MTNKARNRPAKAAEAPPMPPPDGPSAEQQSIPASQGGVNLERFIARYEARVGKLITENLSLEEQLEGTKEELAQLREALDDVLGRLPKSEPADAPSNGQAAKKVAAPRPRKAPKPAPSPEPST